jgi:hypothetical protein
MCSNLFVLLLERKLGYKVLLAGLQAAVRI